jgi:serine/threonine protein kinase
MDDQSHIEALSKRIYPHRRAAEASNGATAPADSVDQLIGERYRLSGRLGSGRLGDIYEAVDGGREAVVERHVAIQLIDRKIASDPRSIDALERGYATLRAGSHPNIVRILDFGRGDRSCFVTMELLEGASLRFVLDEVAVLPLDEAAAVIRAVGDALQYLHAKGLVHGNVRPQNVFITDDYAVKLLDLMPLRRPSPVPYYVEDAATGTPKAPDIADDVFGLASLAYELLSGRHPFNANSPLEAHRAGLKPAPIEHLTLRHWQALARGLAVERADRTPTVAEFLKEFGITGTERLRAGADDANDGGQDIAPPRTSPREAPPETRPMREHRAPPTPPPAYHSPAAPRSEGPADTSGGNLWSRPRSAPARPGPGVSIRMPLLLIVAVGLAGGAFVAYDRLRDGTSELIAAVDGRRNASPPDARSADAVPSPPVDDAVPSSTAGEAVTAPSTGGVFTAPPAREPVARSPDDTAVEPAGDGAPNPEVAASGESAADTGERDASIETDLPKIAIETEPVVAAESPAAASEAPVPTEPPPARTNAAPPPEPRFQFAAPAVTFSESQPAATLVVRRSGDLSMPASIVWWSSDDSALAGEDYADLGQKTENFAPGQETLTLLIPLIGDAAPERREAFYVYLGRFDPLRNHLEPLAMVRVEIDDDD